MTHICPACGKQWECKCADSVKQLHRLTLGAHDIAIACSEKCAQQLRALLAFLGGRLR